MKWPIVHLPPPGYAAAADSNSLTIANSMGSSCTSRANRDVPIVITTTIVSTSISTTTTISDIVTLVTISASTTTSTISTVTTTTDVTNTTRSGAVGPILSCRSDDTYLKLTPVNVNSNLYNYTIHIPNDYPSYRTTGSIRAEFYVGMNVSNIDDFNNEQRTVAKSVLYDAMGNQVLASSELAFFSNEMLLISVNLWQPKDRVEMFDTENEVATKLIVYRFDNGTIRQSDPYILIFKRNE
ncbi:unnamed protein product [Rotaria magnacalcarata]|uniref:Uncharacterized protein n=4 Tax=Rotaria magnacalcarata TaxID=392030 RepID=A0A815ABU9_9BILA|nr:unnamed protein product [Rotaria magnacalcarata]